MSELLFCSDATVVTMGIVASGKFESGRLVYGTLTVCGMVYRGNFDYDGLLNGLGSMTDGTREYLGHYAHGIMYKGITLLNNIVVERGTYTFTNERKMPHLSFGHKIIGDRELTGVFDSLGNIINGTITTETEITRL